MNINQTGHEEKSGTKVRKYAMLMHCRVVSPETREKAIYW